MTGEAVQIPDLLFCVICNKSIDPWYRMKPSTRMALHKLFIHSESKEEVSNER